MVRNPKKPWKPGEKSPKLLQNMSHNSHMFYMHNWRIWRIPNLFKRWCGRLDDDPAVLFFLPGLCLKFVLVQMEWDDKGFGDEKQPEGLVYPTFIPLYYYIPIYNFTIDYIYCYKPLMWDSVWFEWVSGFYHQFYHQWDYDEIVMTGSFFCLAIFLLQVGGTFHWTTTWYISIFEPLKIPG